MKFFDTHAHIGLIYDDPIEQLRVIQQAKQAGCLPTKLGFDGFTSLPETFVPIRIPD